VQEGTRCRSATCGADAGAWPRRIRGRTHQSGDRDPFASTSSDRQRQAAGVPPLAQVRPGGSRARNDKRSSSSAEGGYSSGSPTGNPWPRRPRR
jgi:hypothetical protein